MADTRKDPWLLTPGPLTTKQAMLHLPLKELEALDRAERQRRRERAYARMYQGGAHDVVDSIADIMPCLDVIEERLARGDRP